ncbi:MAG: hypothetical protein ACREET_16095 [Stellaceae bacterium]
MTAGYAVTRAEEPFGHDRRSLRPGEDGGRFARGAERNDEVRERIYIGRRFRNDTERLEKLFELYTKMIADKAKVKADA